MLGLNKLWLSLGALALAGGVLSGAYMKGRWDEKDAYRDRINEMVAAHAQDLKDAAQRNAEQGAEVREVVRYIERDSEEIQDGLAETSDAVCPISDVDQRLLQRALAGPDGLYGDSPG